MTDKEFIQEIERRARIFMCVYVSSAERSRISDIVGRSYYQYYGNYSGDTRMVNPKECIATMKQGLVNRVAEKLLA